MPDERVVLRAVQDARSFEWLLSRSLAESLADPLRAKGWTVTIRPESEARAEDRED